MLDHEDRAVHRHATDEGGDAVDVLVTHARHWLVEQHHFGLDGERGREFERPLSPVGYLACLGIGEGGEAHAVEKLERPGVERVERRLRAPEVEGIAPRSLQRNPHVFERGQVREHSRDLERAHEAEARHVGRPHRRDVAPVERDSPRSRSDEFGQHVETGRLPGAVRADQGVDRSSDDAQGHVADGAEIAEALGKPLGDENFVRAHPRRSPERMRFLRDGWGQSTGWRGGCKARKGGMEGAPAAPAANRALVRRRYASVIASSWKQGHASPTLPTFSRHAPLRR